MGKIIDKKGDNKSIFTKKLIVIVLAIAVLGTGSTVMYTTLSKQDGLEQNKYTVLKSGSNINKINVKGDVVSENNTNVYSNVELTVKEVKVDVGDKVKANDVLAILDTSKLEEKIAELESSIATDENSNKIAFDNAKIAYDNALSQSSDKNNSELKKAEVELDDAQLDFENKKKLYENNKVLCNNNAISNQELEESRIDYENAKNKVAKCTVDLNDVKSKVQFNLNKAKNEYNLAKVKLEDNSKRITLQNLKNDLKNSVVISPVNGVISKKNAVVGNPSTGVLFEIKDEDNVTIKVDIKEVDIDKIKEGQKAEIRTDSTGADIINGEILSIHSLAKDENEGVLVLDNDSNDKEAEFEVKIKISDLDTKLKIGMKAQADIILEESYGAYTVPLESLIKDKDNNDCIYVAEQQGQNYIVKEMPIIKGTQTDSSVEISGENVKDDIIVLNNPSDYEIGNIVKINER